MRYRCDDSPLPCVRLSAYVAWPGVRRATVGADASRGVRRFGRRKRSKNLIPTKAAECTVK